MIPSGGHRIRTSTAINASPASNARHGGPSRGASACGRRAVSGSTREAFHAGISDATTAATNIPATAASRPIHPTPMPAVKTSANHRVNPRMNSSPSGTPMATPSIASRTPSPTTPAATCRRVAPTARSIASVRPRSATPMLSVPKTMNVAASKLIAPPIRLSSDMPRSPRSTASRSSRTCRTSAAMPASPSRERHRSTNRSPSAPTLYSTTIVPSVWSPTICWSVSSGT